MAAGADVVRPNAAGNHGCSSPDQSEEGGDGEAKEGGEGPDGEEDSWPGGGVSERRTSAYEQRQEVSAPGRSDHRGGQ